MFPTAWESNVVRNIAQLTLRWTTLSSLSLSSFVEGLLSSMNTCLLLWNPQLRSVFSLINVLGTWHPCPKLLVFIGWCMVFGLEKEQVGSGDTCSRYRAATFTPFVVTKRSGNLGDCTNYVSPKIISLEEMSLYAWPQFHNSFWRSFRYNWEQDPHNIISQ